jgi:hypothetical protein
MLLRDADDLSGVSLGSNPLLLQSIDKLRRLLVEPFLTFSLLKARLLSFFSENDKSI